jgi:hypothetical protein
MSKGFPGSLSCADFGNPHTQIPKAAVRSMRKLSHGCGDEGGQIFCWLTSCACMLIPPLPTSLGAAGKSRPPNASSIEPAPPFNSTEGCGGAEGAAGTAVDIVASAPKPPPKGSFAVGAGGSCGGGGDDDDDDDDDDDNGAVFMVVNGSIGGGEAEEEDDNDDDDNDDDDNDDDDDDDIEDCAVLILPKGLFGSGEEKPLLPKGIGAVPAPKASKLPLSPLLVAAAGRGGTGGVRTGIAGRADTVESGGVVPADVSLPAANAP